MSIDKQLVDPGPLVGKRYATNWELQLIKPGNDERQNATTDALTGLYNQRYWQEQLPKLEKSNRLAFTAISLDLDNLKTVNDENGHQTGDQLLLDTTAIIQHSFRPEDIIARIGGDEFGVILPYDPEKLQNEYQKFQKANDPTLFSLQDYIENLVTNRLSTGIASFNQSHPGSIPISLSYGSQLSLPDKGKNPPHNLTDTFNQADQKMYRMKQLHHAQTKSNPNH